MKLKSMRIRTKTSITNNVLTYEGNNFKVQMNISWIDDQVTQYALNIIGITAVIIICVTGMAFIFISRNKTIIRAENAQVLAKELESENQQQYEKLQDIMNSSSDIAETLSSQTSELTGMGINLSENVQKQAASIEEVSASLQNVFSTTDKISDNSIFINSFARDVAKHAEGLTNVVSSGKMEKRVIKDIIEEKIFT